MKPDRVIHVLLYVLHEKVSGLSSNSITYYLTWPNFVGTRSIIFASCFGNSIGTQKRFQFLHTFWFLKNVMKSDRVIHVLLYVLQVTNGFLTVSKTNMIWFYVKSIFGISKVQNLPNTFRGSEFSSLWIFALYEGWNLLN